MTVADWIICVITSLMVILLGGLPEKVTTAIVDQFTTHRPVDASRVAQVESVGIQISREEALQGFNEGIYLGRISKVYIPSVAVHVTLQLTNPAVQYRLFPFRGEVGVIRTNRRRALFYQLRSATLASKFQDAGERAQISD